MNYINAFWVGGLICVIGQILIDKTKIMPGRILVIFVVVGAILTGIGIYEPIVEYAGAGATVPISGFGYSMVKGVMKEIDTKGFVGILYGGLKASAAGVSAAILFGILAAIVFNPREKK